MTDLAAELAAIRAELDELKSKDQIRQQIVRYARALEWLDVDLFKQVYHEDAYVDFGFFKGSFAGYWPDVMTHEATKDITFHMCGTVQIELQGEAAEVESYGIAAAREGDLTSFFGGRYLDRFERRGGVWKIARRVYVLDWTFEYRGDGRVEDFLSGLNMVRARSTTHPLYRRMGIQGM